jgi:hypothetical protein
MECSVKADRDKPQYAAASSIRSHGVLIVLPFLRATSFIFYLVCLDIKPLFSGAGKPKRPVFYTKVEYATFTIIIL